MCRRQCGIQLAQRTIRKQKGKKSEDVMVQEDYALEDCEESFTLPRSPKK
jgi:hypothetical protein